MTTEAPVYLWAQGIDNDNGGVERVKQACGLINNDGGVGIEQVIDDTSEG